MSSSNNKRIIKIVQFKSRFSSKILVSSFERANKKEQDIAYPYVEIKIKEDSLTDQKMEMLEEEISQRQIRVCKLKNILTQKQGKVDLTSEDIQQIIPGKIVRDAYRQAYNEEMPDNMTQMLAEVKRTCEKCEQ